MRRWNHLELHPGLKIRTGSWNTIVCSPLPGLRFWVKVIELRVFVLEEGGSKATFLDSVVFKKAVIGVVDKRGIGALLCRLQWIFDFCAALWLKRWESDIAPCFLFRLTVLAAWFSIRGGIIVSSGCGSSGTLGTAGRVNFLLVLVNEIRWIGRETLCRATSTKFKVGIE